MRQACTFFFILIFCCSINNCFSQISPVPADTTRIINIIRANTYKEKTIDSVKYEILVGDVLVSEGSTKFNCDSAIINQRSKTMEAFGNVRINQGDSLFTSSQYIKYLGNQRIAYLKRNVKLTDKHATLTTNDLEYSLATGIGKYNNGGRVVNGKTILTSTQGIYYEDTKDMYFVKNVNVTDPKTKIKADSLLYNSQTQIFTFIGPTYIKNKDGDIYTNQGTYDLKNGSAFFGSRSLIKDTSGRVYQAQNIAFDDKSGQAQLEGNAIIKDTVNRVIVTGNQIFLSRKSNSFLATKKPVLITWDKKDTTYISGDTLFSGFTKRVYTDNIDYSNDSANLDTATTSRIKNDSLKINLNNIKKTETKSSDSIRYFLAYHHVKIFNDSLQAVCDSLFYSGADSVFRLFYQPVIWSGNNQVNGDTIFLYTKNKKAERVYVFENGIVANKLNSKFYNQIAGKTINGYFKDGVIDYIRSKGSPAESIYYIQDKDSAFTGMNRADGSVIDMYFINQQLDKVKFLNDIHGKFYPIRQIPGDMKYLKNFNWLDKRRPKNKLELFE